MHGVRKKHTNSNGDIRRRKLIEYAQEHPWFSTTEAAKALRLKRKAMNKYMVELISKGLLTGRTREQVGTGRPPTEYLYQDNWSVLNHSPYPEVQYYVNRLKKLANTYRTGNIPTKDSLDGVLTELGDDILDLVNTLKLLNMIYNNPDMRKAQTFVTRMDSI